MHIIIHPTYFPNITHFIAIVKANEVTFEVHDNYSKQTYRNRTYIYGANGKLTLNIPVTYSQNNRQKYSKVKIFNTEKWQSNHWKSLLSAYRTSPFFEYYEDDIKPLFTEKEEFLLDFNLKCFKTISECLQLDVNIKQTNVYEHDINSKTDFRYLVNAKREALYELDHYTQVFNEKHGFMSNLSILDLLFNEGPNALNYLESQTVSLK